MSFLFGFLFLNAVKEVKMNLFRILKEAVNEEGRLVASKKNDERVERQ